MVSTAPQALLPVVGTCQTFGVGGDISVKALKAVWTKAHSLHYGSRDMDQIFLVLIICFSFIPNNVLQLKLVMVLYNLLLKLYAFSYLCPTYFV